ncbi:GNAT family N-acetyltransferase [Melittangium boletus]|uniref:GNAT family N-acetyltransferase n=1 Tax=Melittangium boletus TaxID=83453 RepID=UPI003DA4D7E1
MSTAPPVLLRRHATWPRGELLALQLTALRHAGPSHYRARQLEAWGALAAQGSEAEDTETDRALYVAQAGERLAGFGQLQLSTSFVAALYVHPHFEGQGIGTALLTSLERELMALEHEGVQLHASLNAVAFYARRGYRAVGDAAFVGPDNTLVPMVHMVKALDRGASPLTPGARAGK